jgi:glycyl-tRNA synthetase
MAEKNKTQEGLMEKIVSLAKRRGFIFPGSEIYGGLQNSWDYGPLGTELKNNIKQEWWRRFVHQRTDMVGIDAALLMNPKVWEASGHLKNFSDPLVECRKCHSRFRADQIDVKKPCANCGNKDAFTEAKQFNLMLKTFLGPAEEKASEVFFRPETAQAMFVNFKSILETTRRKVPFGIAQIGKAFRNEITPGNFIFRMREFEQMEIEYFIKESEWEGTSSTGSRRCAGGLRTSG